jgi:cytochrome c oxidase subunit 2
VRRRALVLVLASAAASALVSGASAGSGGLAPPAPESPNAQRIADLYLGILGLVALLFVVFAVWLVVLLVRNRRGVRMQAEEGVPGRHRQLVWTLVPTAVLVGLAAVVFALLPDITDAPAASGQETRITVEAHQFYWLFIYPNKATTVNQMVAPADSVVHLDVTAPAGDVNHSWWVPRLGGKIDAIPGRVNETWFKTSPGTYVARCAELCGIQHTTMTGTVHVVPREKYVAFLEQQPAPAVLGKQEFEGVCLTCHRLDEPSIGPALAGNSALSDRNRLEALVRDGVRTMPAVGSTWTDAQIDALYAYTKRLEASGSQS